MLIGLLLTSKTILVLAVIVIVNEHDECEMSHIVVFQSHIFKTTLEILL